MGLVDDGLGLMGSLDHFTVVHIVDETLNVEDESIGVGGASLELSKVVVNGPH